MKLGFKGLAALLGGAVLMSAMVATPASACKGKKAGWKGAHQTKVFGWKKRKCMKAKWRNKRKCRRYL